MVLSTTLKNDIKITKSLSDTEVCQRNYTIQKHQGYDRYKHHNTKFKMVNYKVTTIVLKYFEKVSLVPTKNSNF